MPKSILIVVLLVFTLCNSTVVKQDYIVDENRFVLHESNPKQFKLRLYWKDEKGNIYGSLDNLAKSLKLKGEELIFAMNGGMYLKDRTPQGAFVENGVVKQKINRRKTGYGNFYLQPNGVFYLTKRGKANVTVSENFNIDSNILYATQSGPMLLINGNYHKQIRKNSKNLHIRNGVGILPNGNVLFAMSKKKENFYDLATLFKQKGCSNALYLDGFVSRMYLPDSNWVQFDGNFGVIIGEVK